MIENYAELQRAIEAVGFFTTFQPIQRVGDRMVCASHQYPAGHERQGLHGNSFWVAKRESDWFLGSWNPTIYRLSDQSRLVELCMTLLSSQDGRAYGDFDEAVQSEFGLIPISIADFDRLESEDTE